MVKINYIPWDDKYLKNYIYKNDGIPKNGKEKLSENIKLINDRINIYQNEIINYDLLEVEDYERNLKEDLKKIYDSKSSNIEDLKKEIRQISKTICPYCALQINPYELDHFLPRSIYPEYSILTLNLVPSCPECNSLLKGKQYKTIDNLRAFLHPYFDEIIESKCFLECDLKVNQNLLEVSLKLNFSNLEEQEQKVVNSHFEKLNLFERYKQFIYKDFEKFYKKFIDYTKIPLEFKEISESELKQRINEEINSHHTENCNFYLKVFWKAFKNCNECICLIAEKRIYL